MGSSAADTGATLVRAGEMASRIRSFDWGGTTLGAPESWPQALTVALGICLNSSFPMAIYWGDELRLLYNDGWAPIPGRRHPDALGRPACEVWPDIWHVIGPQFGAVMASGRGYSTSDQHLPMTRSGRLEESYWDYSFIPIPGDDGRVAGIVNQGQEVTARVFERRRHALLLDLSERLRGLDDADAIVTAAVEMLRAHLGVARAGYAEIDIGANSFRITHGVQRDARLADLRGDYTLGAFDGDLHEALNAGTFFAVDDAEEDLRVAGSDLARVYAAAGIRSGLVVPVLKNGAYAAALFIHDDVPRDWTEHHRHLLDEIAERVWQESGRARSAIALRESERRHRLIFEQASDIIFTADLDQRITAANPAAGSVLGVPPQSLIGRSIADFLKPMDFAVTRAMLRRKMTGEAKTRYDVTVQTESGRELYWEINSTLAVDAAGQPVGLHAIARDMTERRAFEIDQRRLIGELNHRVKNTLALVQGLALQSFKGDKRLPDAQTAFQRRLAALAAAHDLLTREKWEGVTVTGIVHAAIEPIGQAGNRVTIAGPTIALAPKAAVTLLMALHELATNAQAHGALSTDRGRVSVNWGETDEGRLSIVWSETDGPPALPPERRGFGLRMVERALAADLDAHVSVEFTPAGLVCRIDAAMPSTRGGAA